jgi:DUF4097 and DUF4098 domain-containing protein YvlB
MKLNLLILLMLASIMVAAQTHSEKITKEMSFEKRSTSNALIISNINGAVKIEGYDGEKIIIEVVKTINGKTEARLEKGKQQVQLGVIDRADTVILFVEDGCNSFRKRAYNKNNGPDGDDKKWGYNWNCNNNNNCRQDYDYTMDFTIKVPKSVNINASTVNDGDIVVEKMTGMVEANNINGSIKLTSLMKAANASTINGDVDIDYTMNPQGECRFYSLNGDINALFQKGLAANLSFESFNGNFYTNIDKISALPAKLEKSTAGEGIKYKVSGHRYQVGSGGVFLDFETFNGDVYLKEK